MEAKWISQVQSSAIRWQWRTTIGPSKILLRRLWWDDEKGSSLHIGIVSWDEAGIGMWWCGIVECRVAAVQYGDLKKKIKNQHFFCKLLKPLIVRGKAGAYWKLDVYKSTLICKWLKTLIVRGKAVASGKVDSYSQTLSLAHSCLTAKWSVLLGSSKIQCHVQINYTSVL